jgi:hypothetical protein
VHDDVAVSFFQAHPSALGWLMLAGLAIFPRITLLFVGPHFGLLAWLGWIFCPHFVVAIIATTKYWDSDPLLCVVAWVFALAGTGGEGRVAHRGVRRRRHRKRRRDDD